LQAIAQAERANREDQQRTKQVGEHAPGGEERDRSHRREASNCGPQHGGGNAQTLQHHENGAAHDQPGEYATQWDQHFHGQAIALANAPDETAQHALHQPSQKQNQQNLQAGHQNAKPFLCPQRQPLFHSTLSNSCCNFSSSSSFSSQCSSNCASRPLSVVCSASSCLSSSLREPSYRPPSPRRVSSAASFSCTSTSCFSNFSASRLCGASCWRSAAAAWRWARLSVLSVLSPLEGAAAGAWRMR